MLGFRVDPAETLQNIFQELQSLHTIFGQTPVLGVNFSVEESAAPLEALTQKRAQDDVEIVDTEEPPNVASGRAYAVDANVRPEGETEIVLSPELGLAIEKLPPGVTASSLWSVL